MPTVSSAPTWRGAVATSAPGHAQSAHTGEGDVINVSLVRSSTLSHGAPTVFVVDDDISVRESIELLVRSAGWQPETFESAQDFLRRPRVLVPSCLVLDVSLPDLSGLELQKCTAVDRPDIPIIFITGHGDVPMTVQAMKGGALEFLTKPFADDVLLNVINNGLELSKIALSEDAEICALRERHASLSCRERQVMALVVRGLLNKQVAAELGISEITVKAHRGRVMQKMAANSLPALVIMAVRLGVSVPKVRELAYQTVEIVRSIWPARACASDSPRPEIDPKRDGRRPAFKHVPTWWITAGSAWAQWKARSARRYPPPLQPPPPNQAICGRLNPGLLDPSCQAKHHPIDPRKHTPGGRHQIGTPAGFKSESVAGFLLECLRVQIGPAAQRAVLGMKRDLFEAGLNEAAASLAAIYGRSSRGRSEERASQG